MARWKTTLGVCLVLAVAGLAAVGWFTHQRWWPYVQAWFDSPAAEETNEKEHHEHADRLRLSPQAQSNLKLKVRRLEPQSFWKTVSLPGMVADRPGESERVVTSAVAGVVQKITALPGDVIPEGGALFTIRILSEPLHTAQAELYKTTREIQINKEQYDRLKAVEATVSPARLIELEQIDRRLKAAEQSYRQELLARGLTTGQIAQAASGTFITEITIAAPRPGDSAGGIFELKELKVNLGDQVQAGQPLCVLSNHLVLYIEGRAFRQESALLERATREAWPIRADLGEEVGDWPPLEPLKIRHISNTVDSASRTFPFFLPLENQARRYERDGKSHVIWRFRPGQRVRLLVPTEEMKNVFVAPAAAVVREGAEAYVFRRNGDVFNRVPVAVIHEDRDSVVLANDGSVGPGQHIAFTSAAALLRALKAQAAGEGGHGHHHDHDH